MSTRVRSRFRFFASVFGGGAQFPISVLFAALKSSLALTRGTGTATFTRATTATVMGYAPGAVSGDAQVLLSCASGEARFSGARRVSAGVWSETLSDGTPILEATLQGYLAEPAATNGIPYSSNIENAVWSKIDATITPAATISPSGASDAGILVEAATSGPKYINCFSVGGTSNVYSIYVKSSGRNQVALYAYGASVGVGFDLSTEAVVPISFWTVGTPIKTSIVHVGGGWYRLSITTAVNITRVELGLATAGAGVYSGDGMSGVFVWGAQLEGGDIATSYIPTTTVAVTRNADLLSYQAASNIDTAIGSASATYSTGNTNAYSSVVSGGALGQLLTVGLPNTSLSYYDGTQAIFKTGLAAQNVATKGASAWGGTTAAITANAATPTGGAFDGTMEATAIYIGTKDTAGNQALNGCVKNVNIYAVKLTDTQLQTVTT